MKHKFSILIADRNPHVRELLRREMTAEGYQAQVAENGRQLIKWAFNSEHFDLLIVDPDLPDVDVSALFVKLRERIPPLPLVVHSFLSDYTEYSDVLQRMPFVEKQGRSIEQLKKVVFEILHKPGQRHDHTSKNKKPYSTV
ncbi:MAG: response regulator [Proteobacteria bacterium]|nr:response regulator [Pseudomonadota bacterium]